MIPFVTHVLLGFVIPRGAAAVKGCDGQVLVKFLGVLELGNLPLLTEDSGRIRRPKRSQRHFTSPIFVNASIQYKQ